MMGHGAGWLTLGAGPRGRRRRDPHPGDPVQGRVDRRRRSRPGAGGHELLRSSRSPRARGRRGRVGARRWPRRGSSGEGAGRRRDAAKAEVDLLEAQHTGQHAAARPPAGAAHRPRVAGLDPRLHPARRDAVAGRPAARDAARHRGRGPGRRRARSGSWSRRAATRPRPCRSTEVAGKRKRVPADHPWIAAARHVGTCLGTDGPSGHRRGRQGLRESPIPRAQASAHPRSMIEVVQATRRRSRPAPPSIGACAPCAGCSPSSSPPSPPSSAA